MQDKINTWITKIDDNAESFFNSIGFPNDKEKEKPENEVIINCNISRLIALLIDLSDAPGQFTIYNENGPNVVIKMDKGKSIEQELTITALVQEKLRQRLNTPERVKFYQDCVKLIDERLMEKNPK